MSSSPPPASESSPTQAGRTRVSKTAAQAAALLLYLERVLASTPGAPGGGAGVGVDAKIAQLTLACALVGLAGSAIAFVLGGRYETVRDGLATLSASACALAYAVLVAQQCIARPDALGLAILVAILLGGGIAAVSCHGKYTALWEVMKVSVRSWVGESPLPDLERGEA